MRHKRLKISAILLFGFGLTSLYAQETITATGCNASGSGGSVSYSVGQIVYTTNTGTTGSAAQGVQQPYEISVVTGLEEVKEINLICTAYPNPTSDFLTLKIEGEVKAQYVASLYDISGKLLASKKVEVNETTFSMENLVSTTYFLKVTQGNKEVKIFKIIKN